MKAIGFDLGNTLVCYEKFPLSWQSLYKDALNEVLKNLGLKNFGSEVDRGIEILTKYNTRINYREEEVTSDRIFTELFEAWDIQEKDNIGIAKKTFYKYFQSEATLYEETAAVLKELKGKGILTGILTDVPYGMDREFVLNDIFPIREYIDVFLMSTDVGYRKPNSKAFMSLANGLGVEPYEMIYIGDEEKDIIGSNKLGIYSILIDRNDTKADYGQKRTVRSLKELLELF